MERRNVVGAWPLAVAVLLPILAGRAAGNQFSIVDIVAFLAGVAGVAGGVIWLVTKRTIPRFRRLEIAWASFLAIALLSTLFSGRGWDAFMGEPTNLLGWGLLAALTCVGVGATAYRPQLREIFARYAWIVVLAECLVALSQASPTTVEAGTLPNSTIFGIATVLLLPWTLAEESEKGSALFWARWVTVLVAILTLAVTGSRIGLLVALVWTGGALWRTKFSRVTKSIAIGAALVVSLAAAFAARGAEFASTLTAAVVGDRPAMWRMGLNALIDRAFIGWGADGFLSGAAASSTVRAASRSHLLMVAPGAADPHNLLVWVAVSTGIIGLTAFVWFSFELVSAWRSEGSGSSAAIWAVVSAIAMVLTAPASIQVLPLFALSVGLSLPLAVATKSKTPKEPRARFAPEAILVAVLLLASALFSANALTRSFYETANSERSVAIADKARAASALWPMDAHLAYLSSIHLAFAAPGNPAVNASQLDLVAIERSVALDRRNPFYANEYARTLRYYDEPEAKILAAYADVFRRYPAFPIGRAEYATYLATVGRTREAAVELKTAELVSALGSAERDAAIANAKQVLGQSPK